MSADLYQNHGYGESKLHRAPAAWKLAVALALVLTVVMLPRNSLAELLGVLVILVVLLVVSRISIKFVLKRMLMLEPLVLGMAGLMWFQPGGGRMFAAIMLKANLCLLTTVVLANTTPFTELVRVLQRLRVPWLFVTTLTLMHRYLFVLADETDRMLRARSSRTFTRGRRIQWQTLASVGGHLFVRSSGRAERIYSAMCARGWK